ncbi:FecR domain-containing protein [uncultured Bacteroides sp.]|uniref:FecR family protein n=1 Tax=uncultured Bacteroides sp. TaxID=162156 RepID=UPI002599DC1A|nr:FecR domain-containing protein [uncultured Bacteroides sp.]
MKELIDKYRDNTLTAEELLRLRQQVNSATDNELEQQLLDDWNRKDMNGIAVDDECVDRMKRQIDRRIGRGPKTSERWRFTGYTYMRVAVGLLLPLLMAYTFYLRHDNKQLKASEVVVSAHAGERASVLLPDGSRVTLNSMSALSYSLGTYNQKARHIHFSGEGYFEVRRDPQSPFIIGSSHLRVEVLGTTFNLAVRSTSKTAELALEEGRVLLISTQKNDSVFLNPSEKAIVDQQTGSITVVKPCDITTASAWMRGELIFRNSPLADILHALGETYHLRFKVECPEYVHNTFTGTLPTKDLNEALEIIELSYNLKASIRNKEVILEKK